MSVHCCGSEVTIFYKQKENVFHGCARKNKSSLQGLGYLFFLCIFVPGLQLTAEESHS